MQLEEMDFPFFAFAFESSFSFSDPLVSRCASLLALLSGSLVHRSVWTVWTNPG
jgi:hypothetical protein